MMRNFGMSAAALLATTTFGGVAHAQEFSGPFVGVQAGWNKDDLGRVDTGAGQAVVDRSKDSFTAGAFIGYDYQIAPRLVIGAEADVGFGIDDEVVRGGRDTIDRVDPKRTFDLTARAGYVVADRTLAYVRGGYANARIRTALTTAAGTRVDASDRDGWLVGGGVERYLSRNVSTRLEYRYTDLGDGGGKYDRHQVLLGASYRF